MRVLQRRTLLLTSVWISAMLLAACGIVGDDSVDGGDGAPPNGGTGDGPAVLTVVDGEPGGAVMSVADALGSEPTGDVVAVRGALFVAADGSMLLCDAIAESFPPQCGGARIAVEGLDLATVAGLQTEGAVSWAEGVTLTGRVE